LPDFLSSPYASAAAVGSLMMALCVVEVRRHRDHRLGDLVAQVRLRVALELAEHLSADLLREPLLAVDIQGPVVTAHLSLDRAHRAIGVRDRLPLRDLADQDLAVLAERHDAWGRPRAFGVRDDCRLAALEDGHHRIRCSKVDPHYLRHVSPPEYVNSNRGTL